MSDILHQAQQRIKQIRQKDVELLVLKNGEPVEDAGVSFRMKNHQFLFGAVCYNYGKYPTQEMNDLFSDEFTHLLNYTMVPFHWGHFEPQHHVYNEPYTSNLIKWAHKHHLKSKLHAVIWHEICPDWLTFDDDITQRYIDRISHLMINYADSFDFIDVANETTVNDRFDNPVSRWVKKIGPINMMKFGTEFVRSYQPHARLVYGDWNVHVEAYYDFLRDMRENDIKIDYLGVQSHMHRDLWSVEETFRVMDRAAAFGWPLHFPEISICSGKPVGETDYSGRTVNQWLETEDDLYRQAELARDFYTLVFSHPATEVLSWFDFIDHRWLGAPAGLVTADLKIKPVYRTLFDLIHREWHSDADLSTGSSGLCKTRLFCGNYDITVDIQGEKTTVNRDVVRESFYAGGGEPRRLVIKL